MVGCLSLRVNFVTVSIKLSAISIIQPPVLHYSEGVGSTAGARRKEKTANQKTPLSLPVEMTKTKRASGRPRSGREDRVGGGAAAIAA